MKSRRDRRTQSPPGVKKFTARYERDCAIITITVANVGSDKISAIVEAIAEMDGVTRAEAGGKFIHVRRKGNNPAAQEVKELVKQMLT